jgi:hypothetical protein
MVTLLNLAQCANIMNYYLFCLIVHLGATVIALWLTSPVQPPPRWTPGKPKETTLKGKHRVYWIPIDKD